MFQNLPFPAAQEVRDSCTTEEIRATWRSIWNVNKDGRADGVQCLPNIWQKVINKGATILKVHKCCSSVNKSTSEISNCCHYFLSNPCLLFRKWPVAFGTKNGSNIAAIIFSDLLWILNIYLISLSKFNLPLKSTFTWPTPPGPHRTTTCRGGD